MRREKKRGRKGEWPWPEYGSTGCVDISHYGSTARGLSNCRIGNNGIYRFRRGKVQREKTNGKKSE